MSRRGVAALVDVLYLRAGAAVLMCAVAGSAVARSTEALAVPATSAASAPAYKLVLRVTEDEREDARVTFRGAPDLDRPGVGGSTMVYGPGAAVALVGLLAHGLLNSAMRDSERRRLQDEADVTLAPLQPVLAGFTQGPLLMAVSAHATLTGTARLSTGDAPTADEWIVESQPVFVMTRDERAVVLDNAVRIYAPGQAKGSRVQTVRVVSAPLADADMGPPGIVAIWATADGRALIDLSVALFAESIELAAREAIDGKATSPAALPPDPAPVPASYRTFRYREGGRDRAERAVLVSADCRRTVVRTLRGGLMSIPIRAEASEACPADARTESVVASP